MHTHKFIFTYEGHAICEEPSCNYRFTLSEIKEILANIANEPAAEQSFAPDAPPKTCEHGNLPGKCPVEICSYSKHGGRR